MVIVPRFRFPLAGATAVATADIAAATAVIMAVTGAVVMADITVATTVVSQSGWFSMAAAVVAVTMAAVITKPCPREPVPPKTEDFDWNQVAELLAAPAWLAFFRLAL